jgi:hypothetical protein
MPRSRAEMPDSVRILVAEYSEFQRRRPDLPQGNLWGLSQSELEELVTAFQLDRTASTDESDAAPQGPPQIH